MGAMDVSEIWQAAADVIGLVPQSGLLIATVVAVLAGWAGSVMVGRDIPLGRLVRGTSTLALGGILILVVLQVSRLDSQFELALPQAGLPEQVVEGGETRIPLARDGHFWLKAEVNGEPVNFMIDTGATLTAISKGTMDRAGIEKSFGQVPMRLSTANGTVAADVVTIDELRFGNVAARGLDAVTAEGFGETNVIGMNLLSRLKSWRVEDNTMILVPNNPQPVSEGSGEY